jgi:hypothetical protein
MALLNNVKSFLEFEYKKQSSGEVCFLYLFLIKCFNFKFRMRFQIVL